MHIIDATMFYTPASGGVRTYFEAKHRHFWHYPGIRHSVLVPGVDCRRANGIHEVSAPPLPLGNGYRFSPRCSSQHRVLRNLQSDLVEVGDPYSTT